MRTEPRYYTEKHFIGDLEIMFQGEQWEKEILDTKVTINGECLCWVTWNQKEEFLKKLQDTIEEYRI